MYKKVFKSEFCSQAHTLYPEEVFGPNHKGQTGEFAFTHKDGWTIQGVISEDYYYWVNEFKASHPTLGWVKGDFEVEVCARSRKAYEDFVSKHPPSVWDYADI